MIGRRTSLAFALAACAASTAATAQTGDIVMRRPIPKNMLTTGAPGQVPSEPDTIPLPPEETVCDEGAGAGAKLTSVKWVEAGWSDGGMNAESCAVQKMTYTCQATYTCTVGGREQSFVSDAPDSVCEGSKDDVQYPGDTPDPTKFPSDRPISDQAAWFTAKFNNAVNVQQSGGPSISDSRVVKVVPWVRSVDTVTWFVPGEYGGTGHHRYIRVFLDPGGTGPYDASTEICRQMHANGHPCSNYYSHEGGSVFVAWIIG